MMTMMRVTEFADFFAFECKERRREIGAKDASCHAQLPERETTPDEHKDMKPFFSSIVLNQ